MIMKELNGFKDISLNFDEMVKISDLIYFDGPLLSYFIGKNKEHYLFYWVDCDDTNNRWLIIRTSLEEIQSYVSKKITLRNVIEDVFDGLIYSVDIDNDCHYNNLQMLKVLNLPEDYLPAADSKYEFEPSDDLDCMAISKKLKSGILEIHFNGAGVNYGTMNFKKMAIVIPLFEKLHQSAADIYVSRIKKSCGKEKKEKKDSIAKKVVLDTDYVFVGAMAGSLRILLKPANTQIPMEDDICGENTYADMFAKELMDLLVSGESCDKIKMFSALYSKDVMSKYNTLVQALQNENLNMKFCWSNFTHGKSYIANIEKDKVPTYIQNLSYLSEEKREEAEYEGVFYSLNIKNGTFGFDAGNRKAITGKFAAALKETYCHVSFDSRYKIVVLKLTKDALGKETEVTITITSIQKIE